MAKRTRISDAERRARLLARHHLGRTAGDVVEAVRGVVAQHSSDPATPYLGAWARVGGFSTADLERALHEQRTLWRLHAMRRTLFVVPTDEAAVFQAAASREVAARERRRIESWLSAEMEPALVPAWLSELEARTLDALAGGERRTQELSASVPELRRQLTVGSGKWSARVPLSTRLLFLMAMDGRVVRTQPAGSWRSSQYRWSVAASWFGEPPQMMEPPVARRELAERYLAAHGPATITDLRWWTGWTVKQAAAALSDAGAVPVDLDSGEGFVLADEPLRPGRVQPHAALLPALDSTPMGWKERDWYAGDHVDRLWDRNGNVGPTVWVDGRIVGGWGQRPDGEVVYRLLEDLGSATADRVAHEAAALTDWLDGVTVTPRFRTPLERELGATAR